MATTINQSPQLYTPAYNDIIYHVTSDNIAEANFAFIGDIYINGNNIGRIRVQPHPVYEVGVFNIQREIEAYLTDDIDLSNTTGVNACSNSILSVYVKFGEEYGATPTVYPDLTTSSTFYAFCGSIPELDFISFGYTTYEATNNGIPRFLTNKFDTSTPANFSIREDQNDWVNFIQGTDDDVNHIRVVTYNSAGATIQTVHITNTNNDVTNIPSRFLRIASGYNLNDVPGGQITVGAQPIITASVAYYEIRTYNASNQATSRIHRFTINSDCAPGTRYNIYFLNNFGAYDSYQFTLATDKMSNITRQEYKKNTGTVSSDDFTVARTDRGFQAYFTSYNDVWKLRSDFINTTAEWLWLKELITSPQVFIEISGALTAVNVINNNHKEFDMNFEELQRLELDIKFSVNNYRQRY